MVALRLEARTCWCGRSGGQYQADGLHAAYYGPARILGMQNQDLHYAERFPPTEPYVQQFPWFVIGHWPGSHITKHDPPDVAQPG
jgi:hypothetical protein